MFHPSSGLSDACSIIWPVILCLIFTLTLWWLQKLLDELFKIVSLPKKKHAKSYYWHSLALFMTNYFRRLTVKCNGQSWTRISFRIKTDYAVTVSDSNLTSQPLFVFMVRLHRLTEDMIPIQAFNLYLNVWDHLTKWLLIRIGPGLTALSELIQAHVPSVGDSNVLGP